MSDSVYSFRAGPTYRAASRQELFDSAMEQPLSLTSTFFDQAKGGALESYGLGTAIRDFAIPEGEATPETTVRSALRLTNPLTAAYESTRLAVQAFREDSPTLDETKYKASPYYRENIPWDAGMTEARAKALAEWNDAKQVRQYYAQKRPISAFLGNLTGQAFDPINYIPVGGPLVKAAAAARAGRVGGAVITGAVDAATNTALAGFATRETRGRFGDDVSFQAMVSEIATAALIGAAFGGVSGAMEARTAARALADAQRTLSTLRTTQEARIALNEAIDGVVSGEDVALSANTIGPVTRVADEMDRASFQRWMAGSKMVDETGNPAVLYHQTARENVGSIESQGFDLRRVGARASDDIMPDGVFLKDTPKFIGVGSFDDAVQMEVLASIRNPLVVADRNELTRILAKDEVFAALKLNADTVDKQIANRFDKIEPGTSDAEMDAIIAQGAAEVNEAAGKARARATQILREQGYDGLIVEKDEGSFGRFARTIVALNPDQTRLRTRIIRPDDFTPTRQTPAPEGRTLAETRIAKPDNYKALADQYRVDPETGDFAELAEIEQLRTAGRLTEIDIANLDAAKTTVDDAKSYAEALKTIVGCLL